MITYVGSAWTRVRSWRQTSSPSMPGISQSMMAIFGALMARKVFPGGNAVVHGDRLITPVAHR